MRAAGVSHGIIYWVGLAVILSGTGLVAQINDDDAAPASKQSAKSEESEKSEESADATVATPVKSPEETFTVPITASGVPMQAFGKKNKRRRSSASSEVLDVLPPMPGASSAEKRKWLKKQQQARADVAKAQQEEAKAQQMKNAQGEKTAPLPSKEVAKPAPAELKSKKKKKRWLFF